MISNKWMIAIWIIILGLYVQPILAQESAKNLTATVNTFTGDERNKELKGNLIITENEGTDKKINISFTNLIEENSNQLLDKSNINLTSADINKDQSKYIVTVKGYGVWVGEISINTTGIKSGTYDGKAIIEGANFTPLNLGLSVKLSKPTWQKLLVLGVAAFLIIIAMFLILVVKNPIYGLPIALFPVLGGIILLYIFPSSDAQENTLLTTSFFIPLAAYIVDSLKTRRDERLSLEKSVTEVQKKAIEDAVDFHSKLIEELNTHAATFSCIKGVGANPLEDEIWKDGKKKTGMVSDYPGYKLARYYQYTDDFNNYLKVLTTGLQSLFSWDDIPGNGTVKLIDFLKQSYSVDWVKAENIKKSDDGNTISASDGNNSISLSFNNDKTKVNLEIDERGTEQFVVKVENDKQNIYQGFNDFCSGFDQFNKAYKELEDILYLNLFYNIGSFQYKFHSFKEIEVPFRIPNKLRHYLADITGEKMYLFSWDGITKNDKGRLIVFLKKNFGIDWDDKGRLREFLNQNFGINWDDKGRLREFLNQNFGIKWVKTAEIKSEDKETIKVSYEEKYVLLKLNYEQTEVNLEIDDGRTDKFIANTGKIYEKIINNDKIYNEKVALKLNKKIDKQFMEKYKNLQEKLQALNKFKNHKEPVAETSSAKKPSVTVTCNEGTTPSSISITYSNK